MADQRFAADAMLARLARWLRALGHDTSLDASLSDSALVQMANEEDRILLTCDRRLLRELKPARAVELRQAPPLQQLQALASELDLSMPAELFTRCTVCNTPLALLERPAADALLPAGIRGIAGPVRRCPGCARVYWQGSHTRRMREALEHILGAGTSASNFRAD